MITRAERGLVELVRQAKDVGIAINIGDKEKEIQVSPIADEQLAHDVAIALQSYFTREEKKKHNDGERQGAAAQGGGRNLGGDTPYGRPSGQRRY